MDSDKERTIDQPQLLHRLGSLHLPAQLGGLPGGQVAEVEDSPRSACHRIDFDVFCPWAWAAVDVEVAFAHSRLRHNSLFLQLLFAREQ